jgi:hypothetical protein
MKTTLPDKTHQSQGGCLQPVVLDAPTCPGWWWLREVTGEWYPDPVLVTGRMTVSMGGAKPESLKRIKKSGWTGWNGPLLPPLQNDKAQATDGA